MPNLRISVTYIALNFHSKHTIAGKRATEDITGINMHTLLLFN